MGQLQHGAVATQIPPPEQIEIEAARTPALQPPPTDLLLQSQKIHQQRLGLLIGGRPESLHQQHRIQIVGLIGRSAHRCGAEQRRPAQAQACSPTFPEQPLQWPPHRLQRLARGAEGAGEIGAQGDGRSHGRPIAPAGREGPHGLATAGAQRP